MNIYVSGSIAYDRIMDFHGKFSDHILADKIHILNVCFTVNRLVEKLGGTAGNIAYSLSLLKEKPIILATIGKDYKTYFERLDKFKISKEGIKIISNEFTAGAYITTDMSDNQITGFNPGAMKHQSYYQFNTDKIKDSFGIIAAGNLQDMISYADFYKKNNIPYVCDPGQSLTGWNSRTLKNLISGSKILISNDYELQLIINMTGWDKTALLKKTEIIITTLGEQGSIITTKNNKTKIPIAKPDKVVDPTGAGDAFRAGLIKGIVSGKDIETSAKIGAVTSTFAVEHYGTQEYFFTYKKFTERFEKNFGYKI